MAEIGQRQASQTVTMPSGARIGLEWTALTDRGHQRSLNEDSYVVTPVLFAVADGMGGHSAGDFASAAVVQQLSALSTAPITKEAVGRSLNCAVDDIESGVGGTEMGTGTTVTGIGLTEHDAAASWLVFNIGDSRVYRLADHGLEQITVDHSIVQELIDAGSITSEQAEVHPHANVITRAVGFNERPVADFHVQPVVTGERFLITSDGLMKELTDQGIQHFLDQSTSTEQAAERLLHESLGNGGRDNITVIVVDVVSVTGGGEAV